MLKLVFLFLSVWMSLINIGRLIKKNDVSTMNIIMQAIGITGFIYLQWMN